MKTLKALLQKYKDIVLYVVFGGLTTLVNIVSFYVLEQLLAVATVPSACPSYITVVPQVNREKNTTGTATTTAPAKKAGAGRCIRSKAERHLL